MSGCHEVNARVCQRVAHAVEEGLPVRLRAVDLGGDYIGMLFGP